jgi:hypothetical protein
MPHLIVTSSPLKQELMTSRTASHLRRKKGNEFTLAETVMASVTRQVSAHFFLVFGADFPPEHFDAADAEVSGGIGELDTIFFSRACFLPPFIFFWVYFERKVGEQSDEVDVDGHESLPRLDGISGFQGCSRGAYM